MLSTIRTILFLASLLLAFPASGAAQDFSDSVCRVVIYDETVELEDSRIAVDLARSAYGAYEKVFRMIEGLWEAKTIPRMDYIKAKYDQDAARLELERYGLILQRQEALVEQYQLICGREGAGEDTIQEALSKAYRKYRRADCDALGKGIEVAETNLEYYREYRENILKLRKENFATNTQVILAELDVEQEEKRLADAKRRAAACSASIEAMDSDSKSASP